MSGSGGQHRLLLNDLRRYLNQRLEDGMTWYLDAGPVSATSPLAPAPVHPVSDPATPSRPATTTAAVQESLRSLSGRNTAGKDDFAKRCEAFVQETLARIDKSPPQVTQQDIFAVSVEQPKPRNRKQKSAALQTLAAEVAPCTQCQLYSNRTQTVFGVGSSDADLVFIGEAPGRDEDLQGEPFVGRAGQLLNEILKAIGFRRQDVYICNILKCRPPQNRDPEREEVESCEPYLKQQLEILEPKIICCLGRVAAQTLLGTRASLTSMRETIHFYAGIPVLVTFHPAALLRNPNWKRPTWEDVRKLRALYDALKELGSAQAGG